MDRLTVTKILRHRSIDRQLWEKQYVFMSSPERGDGGGGGGGGGRRERDTIFWAKKIYFGVSLVRDTPLEL